MYLAWICLPRGIKDLWKMNLGISRNSRKTITVKSGCGPRRFCPGGVLLTEFETSPLQVIHRRGRKPVEGTGNLEKLVINSNRLGNPEIHFEFH